jgi:hypothetical protein
MSMVRFATTCDVCGVSSSEYSSWPMCVVCGKDVCDSCRRVESDDNERNSTVCQACYAEDLGFMEAQP